MQLVPPANGVLAPYLDIKSFSKDWTVEKSGTRLPYERAGGEHLLVDETLSLVSFETLNESSTLRSGVRSLRLSMDSNRIRTGREQWQTRRLSQDIGALHSTIAARSARLAPTSNQTREDRRVSMRNPDAISEEDYAKFTAGLDRPYQSFLSRVRNKLMACKDDKGNSLYTAQQVQAQLSEANQPTAGNDRCFGEYGGITYFTHTDIGMDHLHANVPVNNLTSSQIGMVHMDQKWQSSFEDAEVDFRWIHLPANNMEWTKSAMRQILKYYVVPEDDKSGPAMSFASTPEDRVLSQELWDEQQNVGLPEIPHARFMRPFCRKVETGPFFSRGSITPLTAPTGPKPMRRSKTWQTVEPDRIQAALANSIVLFMPFLHWESTLAYMHMKSVIADVDTGGIGVFCSPDISKLPCGIDEKLLRHYLQHLEPIHVRRTLDQFGYYTIADTTSRDKDQVVDRYARAHRTTDLVVPPMLMVDQCWLWLLGGNTILTCFPHRWNKNFDQTEESTDVYQNILELLDDPFHRLSITSASQLAFMIIDRCAMNVLDRNLIKDDNLRFLDFFDASCDDLNEQQSQCLQALWKDVQASSDENHDSLIDISKEFDILEKIKDIIDELQIVLRMIDQQIFAFSMILKDEADAPFDMIERESSNGDRTPDPLRPRPETIDFAKLRDRASERATGIKAMIERANTTYDATLDVLSLKQQQANISEARSSRKAAQEMELIAKEAKKAGEEAEKQGYSVMLFTIVTIFFLPMSAVAGIFGVNAVEFGQGKIHLWVIFAYLIPISVFVVYISFLLAFNHKARRTVLLCLQIVRAWLNLAYPIVFDEHKESRLQNKLMELKARRRQQRERKFAKIRAAEAASSKNSRSTADFKEGAIDSSKPEVDITYRSSVEAPPNSGSSLRRYQSAGSGTGVFKWGRFKTRSREMDQEAGPAPSETGSPHDERHEQ